MLGRSRIGTAIAVLLSMAVSAPLAWAADPPLSPQASAFKQEGMQDCISNYVYRGLEYKDAEAQCDCVFEVYARRLTPARWRMSRRCRRWCARNRPTAPTRW